MAKRFTDTDKYKKTFFRGLQGAYKLLWDYLYHECNHSGIWIVDFEIAQIYIGSDMPVNKKDALSIFNKDEDRIIEINNGKLWFIPSFVEFQYGTLNPANKVHNSVLNELSKWGLIKGLSSPLQGAKDKSKEKEKDKSKEKEIPLSIENYMSLNHEVYPNNLNRKQLPFELSLFLETRYKREYWISKLDALEKYDCRKYKTMGTIKGWLNSDKDKDRSVFRDKNQMRDYLKQKLNGRSDEFWPIVEKML